tara:strand:+ start:10449 stop:10739 length:291 start_codon:yes stop_codon:yes gene_type:complete
VRDYRNNYRPLPDMLTIQKSKIHGLGLFCINEIDPGVCIGITHVFKKRFGVVRTPLGGFLNHSDNPNCFILEKGDQRYLYSVRKIRNEELTVFYRF